MGTFLTTKRMHPALAARVDASVRGRRGGAPSLFPRARSVVRVLAIAGVLAAIAFVVAERRSDRRKLEDARADLLRTVSAKSAPLSPDERDAAARIEASLVALGGAYEGDYVAGELRAPGAIAALLAREAVYVRMPVRALSDAASVTRAAAESYKDALLLCLLAPPDSRVEKALLAKARAAHAAEILERTTNAHRLGDAERGLPFLSPAWSRRIESAERIEDLEALRRVFERAPIDEAVRAARAGLLIAALDEDGDGRGPTELDGERPHDVRVHVLDLAAGTTLLRVRRHVDPGAISASARATHAKGIDGCALALDVREVARGG